MNFTGNNRMQGDVQLFEITKIPQYAKLINKQFLAKSEKSGSLHAVFGKYNQYEVEGGFVLDVKEESILNHTLESILNQSGIDWSDSKVLEKKDHRHCVIPVGIHFVSIQSRFDPLSGLKEKVRD
jgi:hypothetical protein